MAQNKASNLVLLFALMGRAMAGHHGRQLDHVAGHHGTGDGGDEWELVGDGGCLNADGIPGALDPSPGNAPDPALDEYTKEVGNPTKDMLCKRRCMAVDWCSSWSYIPEDKIGDEWKWNTWLCYYYTSKITSSDGESSKWQCWKKPEPTAAPSAGDAMQTSFGALAFIGAFVSHYM